MAYGQNESLIIFSKKETTFGVFFSNSTSLPSLSGLMTCETDSGISDWTLTFITKEKGNKRLVRDEHQHRFVTEFGSVTKNPSSNFFLKYNFGLFYRQTKWYGDKIGMYW